MLNSPFIKVKHSVFQFIQLLSPVYILTYFFISLTKLFLGIDYLLFVYFFLFINPIRYKAILLTYQTHLFFISAALKSFPS
jgi:hypothetical protein